MVSFVQRKLLCIKQMNASLEVVLLQEFDRQESKKVQELFDSISQILYENDTSGSCASHLCHECREWTTRFTHLRC